MTIAVMPHIWKSCYDVMLLVKTSQTTQTAD